MKVIYLGLRAGKLPKTIAADRVERGEYPAWAERIVRVESATSRADAERLLGLAERASARSADDLDRIEDREPRLAGELRRAKRRVRDVTDELRGADEKRRARKRGEVSRG